MPLSLDSGDCWSIHLAVTSLYISWLLQEHTTVNCNRRKTRPGPFTCRRPRPERRRHCSMCYTPLTHRMLPLKAGMKLPVFLLPRPSSCPSTVEALASGCLPVSSRHVHSAPTETPMDSVGNYNKMRTLQFWHLHPGTKQAGTVEDWGRSKTQVEQGDAADLGPAQFD